MFVLMNASVTPNKSIAMFMYVLFTMMKNVEFSVVIKEFQACRIYANTYFPRSLGGLAVAVTMVWGVVLIYVLKTLAPIRIH